MAFLIQLLSDNKTQQRIAQELKTLIRGEVEIRIFIEVGAVNQGLLKQRQVFKGDTQNVLQGSKISQVQTPYQARIVSLPRFVKERML